MEGCVCVSGCHYVTLLIHLTTDTVREGVGGFEWWGLSGILVQAQGVVRYPRRACRTGTFVLVTPAPTAPPCSEQRRSPPRHLVAASWRRDAARCSSHKPVFLRLLSQHTTLPLVPTHLLSAHIFSGDLRPSIASSTPPNTTGAAAVSSSVIRPQTINTQAPSTLHKTTPPNPPRNTQTPALHVTAHPIMSKQVAEQGRQTGTPSSRASSRTAHHLSHTPAVTLIVF